MDPSNLPRALLKLVAAAARAQIRRALGDETLRALAEAFAELGEEELGRRLEAWLQEADGARELAAALERAEAYFLDHVQDPALRQWAVDLPLRDLPSLLEALERLPDDPDEDALEAALREAIRRDWRGLSEAQVDHGVRTYLAALRRALLPVEGQALAVVGRAVLRVEEEVARLREALEAWARREQVRIDRSVRIEGAVQYAAVVTGDHNTVNFFVADYRELPTDYSAYVKRFIEEYLGTEERPVPFGGREAELRTLSAWLEDPDAPPCFLLTAPAGRGKSALLVRWTAALQGHRDLEVLFIPISIRFGTNRPDVFLAMLVSRLAQLHGEKPPTTDQNPTIWQGMIADYLRRALDGRRLLVVLDGLDEAAGEVNWRVLFPTSPPEGLRVLVSARETATHPTADAWRRALGWENAPVQAETLAGLTREGVADVLEKMGVPLDRLARNVDVVAELHRLSEGGDPLLVKLYVEDLWSRGEEATRLKPEDLRGIEPGYRGFFERWWEDQEKLWEQQNREPLQREEVERLFYALAAAQGPLRRDELRRLTGLSSLRLREALKPLARFVIQGEAGYAYAHPKLGQFFWEEELSEEEREEWDERFLAWGREVLQGLKEGTLPPKKAAERHPYILQYYTAHLARAERPLEDYLPLIHTHAWAEAWHALEGSYGGYVSDVGKVWEKAKGVNEAVTGRGEPASVLGVELRCALIEASVRSLAANIPVALLVNLVKYGVWSGTQALTYARQMPDPKQRAEALANLAPHLPPGLLPDALDAARQLLDPKQRAEALTALTPHLPDSDRGAALSKALHAARSIDHPYLRARALADLAPLLPPNLLPDALEAARQIPDDPYGSRAHALANLAPHLPQHLLPDALETARSLPNDFLGSRAHAFANLAPHLPPDLLPDALEAAREISDPDDRARALDNLAPPLPPNILPDAPAAARQLEPPRSRAEALANLAPLLPPEDREAALAHALEAAREISDPDDRARALANLAPHLPPNLLPDALEAARQIDHPRSRAEALANLAPLLPPEKREAALAHALEAARQIPYPYSRAQALTSLTPHLAPEDREAALAHALEAARSIDHPYPRARALAALAPHLPEPDRKAALAHALAAARSIDHPRYRARALANLAPHLPPNERETALVDALYTAREITDPDDRAQALTSLASHLAQLPLPTLYPLFHDTLHHLARRTRRDLLGDLRALLPVLERLGGPEALEELARAIVDVGEWWP